MILPDDLLVCAKQAVASFRRRKKASSADDDSRDFDPSIMLNENKDAF
jgi:hypothetical protein